ncbi:hypothetical protein IT895_10460 [Halomonas sp. A40-4]|jgi:LDH2 family malate/lactate/ureidoglycolate dehydrogenase|uniref:hypothetical protein n=1 Tax=Halomonas sp. A40-4 TaxID=2785909 RepID=UPI0018EFBE84|nr:hypothetical protein [Halomonas sp. A40-4]QPL44648.1 hypothetical protein IT895_10460 [Halomonas sp. A40-4]
MEVIYDEAIYSDSQGQLRFPFYQAMLSQGNIEIDKHYRYTENSASLPLTLPTA